MILYKDPVILQIYLIIRNTYFRDNLTVFSFFYLVLPESKKCTQGITIREATKKLLLTAWAVLYKVMIFDNKYKKYG